MMTLNISLTLITSITVFLVIILLLTIIILIAKKLLISSGKVKVSINSDKELEVEQGDTLLKTLSNNSIYLPSACGGKGSCGVCKCKVIDGGGSLLPTETAFISRKEEKENWRLACQVKVKNDLSIIIPNNILEIKKYDCEVISNNNLSTYIKELVIKISADEKINFLSGEYIQIDVPPVTINYDKDIEIKEEYFKNEWEKRDIFSLKMKNDEILSRAYSMANYPEEGNIIKLNVRIALPPLVENKKSKKKVFSKLMPGISSSYIFSLKAGDKIKISGPFGDFHIKDSNKEMIFIGGGAGMAPLRSQIFHLLKTENSKRKISYWYGARSLQEMFYLDDFLELEKNNDNFRFNLALSEPQKEDNWQGYTGFIHKVLFDNYLSKHKEPEEIEYYICGPKPMTDAVLEMLENLGVEKKNIFYDDFGS